MNKLKKATLGIGGFSILGITIIMFNENIQKSLLIIGIIGLLMFFWLFFVLLKQNEANCDRSGWSEQE